MTNQSAVKENIALLFQRPNEPLFAPKDNGKVVFDVPSEFYTDRYKIIGTAISSRFGTNINKTVHLRSDIQSPNLDFIKPIKKQGPFSLFNKQHQQIAGELIRIFIEIPDLETLLSTAAYCKDRTNAYLFTYALAVAVQHRKDSQDIQLPNIVEQFPDQFVDSSIFPKVREEGKFVDQENRVPVEIQMNFTASDREPEQRLAYFREDLGVNSHHWHWHLVYPGEGPRDVVAKDRRGELFYYMHSQLIARYNNERFCNRLERVKPLNNLRERIIEGYFPKIIRGVNNRAYPARFDNSILQDLNRDDDTVEIADLIRWTDRIHQAIDQGYVLEYGTNRQISLNEMNGINILGDIIEASSLSPNPQLYGNLHNMGHNIISYVHDPDNRHLEDYGVMADVTTAMRDPIFYRWHSFLDTIFTKYKNTLPPYHEPELIFDNIIVNSVEVQIKSNRNVTANLLLTFWQKSNVDLGAGLDFGPGNVYAQYTHLQHAPFDYNINVTNNSQTIKQGTCRIFLVPKGDERDQTLRFRDQRSLAIELDKFTITLNPGENNIVHNSQDSSVTVPYERSFRRVGYQFQPTNTNELNQFQFCGCGWPDHMLLPKGTVAGTKCDLFVMVSDYEQDRVDQTTDWKLPCNDAFSFCGLNNQKYPDKRAMGYPFDKNTQFIPNQDVATLGDFVQRLPNAALGECTIRFTNTIIGRE